MEVRKGRITTRRWVLAPFGALALLTGVASVAYACTAFNGTFSVTVSTPNGSGTSTVTGTDCQNVGGMTQTINSNGATNTHGTTGTITISTGTAPKPTGCVPLADTTTQLPRSSDVGNYDINYLNGAAYTGSPQHWSNDCMDVDGIAPSGAVKLGSTTVGAAGTITGTTQFSFSAGNAQSPAGTASAVCITDANGFNGNQAPITIT